MKHVWIAILVSAAANKPIADCICPDFVGAEDIVKIQDRLLGDRGG